MDTTSNGSTTTTTTNTSTSSSITTTTATTRSSIDPTQKPKSITKTLPTPSAANRGYMEAQVSDTQLRCIIRIIKTRLEGPSILIVPFEPSDGNKNDPTHVATYQEYVRREREAHAFRKRHHHTLAAIPFKPQPPPIDEATKGLSIEVMLLRSNYERCAEAGFVETPWRGDRPTCKWNCMKLEDDSGATDTAARVGWNWEGGFRKEYREQPLWMGIDFDAQSLAPDELAPGVFRKRESWGTRMWRCLGKRLPKLF